MFKRSNKITSILVAVAAIISIMPSGVSAASKDTKAQDGEIYNAIAYKDGKFYISGEPDDEDEAAYYLSDGKYSELDDIDSEDKAEIYGSKYVEVEEGNYYVDLSTGKISDDDIQEKELDDCAIKLRSSVKADNDGRYDTTDAKEIKVLTQLENSKFGQGWYATQYDTDETNANINGGSSTFNVYSDKDGKYIDADYNLGKVKVKLSNGKTANIENTNDEDEGVRGNVTSSKVIGQDSNNIYRLGTITVKSSVSGVTIKEVNGVEISDEATSLPISADGTSVSFDVIQVISKAQASKEISGIKYAKTVTNYVLSDKSGKKIDLLSDDEKYFTIADGTIVDYKIDGDSITAQSISLKNKSSVYYIDVNESDDIALQDEENSVDIDAEGNLWVLSDEVLYKFDNDEDFEEVYELDEEYNDLSVYDKDNLVVWNLDDGIYSIISKDTVTDDDKDNTNTDNDTTPGTNPTPETSGWVRTSNGSWNYNNKDGTKFKGWLNSNETWYYLDTDGTMSVGWKLVNNKWYFMDSSGIMKTGWLNDGGNWYYLNTSGEMLSNTTISGYKLGKNGAWVK